MSSRIEALVESKSLHASDLLNCELAEGVYCRGEDGPVLPLLHFDDFDYRLAVTAQPFITS